MPQIHGSMLTGSLGERFWPRNLFSQMNLFFVCERRKQRYTSLDTQDFRKHHSNNAFEKKDLPEILLKTLKSRIKIKSTRINQLYFKKEKREAAKPAKQRIISKKKLKAETEK